MNKKKAIVCTILFTIIVISTAIALMFIKPYDSEFSLFHAFSPFIFGIWIVDRIEGFYKWLTK